MWAMMMVTVLGVKRKTGNRTALKNSDCQIIGKGKGKKDPKEKERRTGRRKQEKKRYLG